MIDIYCFSKEAFFSFFGRLLSLHLNFTKVALAFVLLYFIQLAFVFLHFSINIWMQ